MFSVTGFFFSTAGPERKATAPFNEKFLTEQVNPNPNFQNKRQESGK